MYYLTYNRGLVRQAPIFTNQFKAVMGRVFWGAVVVAFLLAVYGYTAYT